MILKDNVGNIVHYKNSEILGYTLNLNTKKVTLRFNDGGYCLDG